MKGRDAQPAPDGEGRLGLHAHPAAGGSSNADASAFPGAAVRDEDSARASRLRLAAARTLARAAGGAQSLAGRAAEAGGAARRAEPLARHAARHLGSMVGYLESNETKEMIGDLETAVRRHPLRALTVAFLAGYLARRVL